MDKIRRAVPALVLGAILVLIINFTSISFGWALGLCGIALVVGIPWSSHTDRVNNRRNSGK